MPKTDAGSLPRVEASPGHARVSGYDTIWDAVDVLVDTAPRLSDLRSHRIDLLAARRWRMLGGEVPSALVDEERRLAVLTLGAPAVLRRARDAYEGRMLLLKGPEVASWYPEPALRRFGDLDLLVDDAEGAYTALLGAGFEPVGDPALYVGIHHLRPLCLPGLPLPVELHSRPKWIDQASAPAANELFAVAVGARVGVDGLLTLPPSYHAVALAAHSWAHEPLRRLGELLDIAILLEEGDRTEAQAIAGAWGIERLWKTTVGAADAVFRGRRQPWTVRIWARNLMRARERTVLESHLEHWLSNFAVLPPHQALRELSAVIRREFGPEEGERWREKLVRTRMALRNASVRRSEHDDELARRRGT